MRYLSLCSGIEAASVAWHHLGWTPVAFSEIEPFPSAVLAHRFPTVPNFGDMTKHEQWPIERGSVDLLVGGTPCQSFSVAGLRHGLADPRGNLMLTYLAIAARLRPRWLVWENVPGVLSSNGGRDFGTFLRALGELGYGWAYRVLDAQYVRVGKWPRAVPQRRRRVFVVGCLGDWTAAAEVLALREGMQRHLEASRKTRKGAAADAEGGARGGCWWDGSDCSGTLTAENAGGGQRMPDCYNLGAVLQPTTVRSGSIGGFVEDTVGGTMRHHGGDLQGGSESLVIAQPVAFQQNTRDEVRLMNGDGQIAGALAAEAGMKQQKHECTPTIGTTRTPAVAHAFYSTGGTHGVNQHPEVSPAVKVGSGLGIPAPPAVAHALAVRTAQTSANGHGIAEGVSHTLDQAQGQAIAQMMTVRRLTPRECERLQGFPDDWTLIPWRGKPAEECPDGPRYKALGNSMACNCMAWIGERINTKENT